MKGSSNCTVILPMASRVSPLPASAPSNSITSSGVTKIPSRLEVAALHTAAATLPRASEVKAIADCTVAGRAQRNSMPRYSSCPISGARIGLSSSPSTGNRMKVQENTSRCSRQWVAPAQIASRDSLAPCMKNSRPIARLVIQPKTTAVWPCTGSTLAVAMAPTRHSVKLSGRKRGLAMRTLSGLQRWGNRRVYWDVPRLTNRRQPDEKRRPEEPAFACSGLDGDLEYTVTLVGEQVVGRSYVIQLVLVGDQYAQIQPVRGHHVHQPAHAFLATRAQRGIDPVVAQTGGECIQRQHQILGVDPQTGQGTTGLEHLERLGEGRLGAQRFDRGIGAAATGQPHDLVDHIAVAEVQRDIGAHLPGDIQPVVVAVHGNDGGCPEQPGTGGGAQANRPLGEDHHGITDADVGILRTLESGGH